MMDDMDGHVQFGGLAALPCATEEEALNLLFTGDTNRVMCETPMNDASSRSHCIFTINVESTRQGSDVVRKSKLHLVDLAGSERGASFKMGSTKVSVPLRGSLLHSFPCDCFFVLS
jgi:kinesin family protein 6/9